MTGTYLKSYVILAMVTKMRLLLTSLHNGLKETLIAILTATVRNLKPNTNRLHHRNPPVPRNRTLNLQFNPYSQ